MTVAYIVTVAPKLGQGLSETLEAIEGALFDLKDYGITIQFLGTATTGKNEPLPNPGR